MKRLAPGLYEFEQYRTFVYIVKDGERWRYTRGWHRRFSAEQRAMIVKFARMNHFIYPTLAMAISAAKGNHVS